MITKRALLLPLCMLCVQCGASQQTSPAAQTAANAAPEEEMRPAALVAPPILRAEPPDGETVSSTLNDAQMAGVVEAIVESQVAQANVAARKSGNTRVAELAAVIITRRTAIQQDLAAFVSALPYGTEDSKLLGRIQVDAQDVTGAMTSLTGSAFDAAYVGGQIHEFQSAIAVLDTRIIPHAKSPEIRSIAAELRNAIVQNLAAARALRNELAGSVPR